MIKIAKLSDKQQLALYLKLSKKELANMLLQCDKLLDKLRNKYDIYNFKYNKPTGKGLTKNDI